MHGRIRGENELKNERAGTMHVYRRMVCARHGALFRRPDACAPGRALVRRMTGRGTRAKTVFPGKSGRRNTSTAERGQVLTRQQRAGLGRARALPQGDDREI